jgi:hypothetical protein
MKVDFNQVKEDLHRCAVEARNLKDLLVECKDILSNNNLSGELQKQIANAIGDHCETF